MYKNFTEACWQHVTCFLTATITNAGHQVLTLETPTYSIVDTFWFTPVALKDIYKIVCMIFTV